MLFVWPLDALRYLFLPLPRLLLLNFYLTFCSSYAAFTVASRLVSLFLVCSYLFASFSSISRVKNPVSAYSVNFSKKIVSNERSHCILTNNTISLKHNLNKWKWALNKHYLYTCLALIYNKNYCFFIVCLDYLQVMQTNGALKLCCSLSEGCLRRHLLDNVHFDIVWL